MLQKKDLHKIEKSTLKARIHLKMERHVISEPLRQKQIPLQRYGYQKYPNEANMPFMYHTKQLHRAYLTQNIEFIIVEDVQNFL